MGILLLSLLYFYRDYYESSYLFKFVDHVIVHFYVTMPITCHVIFMIIMNHVIACFYLSMTITCHIIFMTIMSHTIVRFYVSVLSFLIYGNVTIIVYIFAVIVINHVILF